MGVEGGREERGEVGGRGRGQRGEGGEEGGREGRGKERGRGRGEGERGEGKRGGERGRGGGVSKARAKLTSLASIICCI